MRPQQYRRKEFGAELLGAECFDARLKGGHHLGDGLRLIAEEQLSGLRFNAGGGDQ